MKTRESVLNSSCKFLASRLRPNGSIALGCEELILRVKEQSIAATAEVSLTLRPSPRILLEVESAEFGLLGSLDETVVNFPTHNVHVRCLASTTRLRPNGGVTVRLIQLGGDFVLGDSQRCLRTVDFVIPNFPKFMAARALIERSGQSMVRVDRIVLEFGGWNVEIKNVPRVKDPIDVLREDGGFAVTAIGSFNRADETEFTLEEASEALNSLRLLLSFACGRWTGPTLQSGIDTAGNTVWRRLALPLLGEWSSVKTWFDVRHAESLGELSPGFWKLWCDPHWKDTLSRAVYWFVRADKDGAGPDASLILSQAALEALSWTYLVSAEKQLNKKKFNELSAAERIRKFLTALEIPVYIPQSLLDFQRHAERAGWEDGCDAISKTRNSLVHTERRGGPFPIVESWILAQHFLELALLRLCGYSGQISNRTLSERWVGQVEPVPRCHRQG